ncbi:GT-D fold domain-containing glycosyltransferase [Pseudobutyrivibrio sp. MD2005]|uniref:GT-D fold domain-containing glycosyltransferase n=1 Tax=Pseudobutyrivibrio sp. MD2005 TaxID=1410616 RepID=UPI0006847806|nr:GT-D fold domain-containing glycosyltransferase [Pseudobutyrivibrio sp. MD2005]
MEKKTVNVIIWGTGFWGQMAYSSIDFSCVKIIKVIDSDYEKIGKVWNGLIIEENDINWDDEENCDYIILCMKDYYYPLELCKNISSKKIIFSRDDLSEYQWIDSTVREKYYEDKKQLSEHYAQQNKKYEKRTQTKIIVSAEQCLKKIIYESKSLTRFGDGEFEIMLNRDRPWFQKYNESLAYELLEVMNTENDELLIAIPDEFDSLEQYTDEAAFWIRSYIWDKHDEIEQLIDTNRTYYDSYVSRPYLIYRDKTQAKKIFNLWKQVWKGRDILLIEGANTRNGLGNDLFNEVKSLSRIICPAKDAFSIYESIIEAVLKNIRKEILLLISLGPTATVLVKKFVEYGYQAIDIGQIDNEYEWYQMAAKERIPIKGKAVPELNERLINEDLYSEDVKKQILIDLTK